MKRSEPSLFLRLTALMSLVLAMGAGVLMASSWYSARQAADEAYDRLLLGAAFQIADAIAIQDGDATIEMPLSAFELLSLSEEDRIFYRVLDPAGRTLTGYENLPEPPGDDRTSVSDGFYQREAVRIARVSRTFDDPQLRGNAVVVVAQTVGARTALARQLILRSLFLVAAMSIIAIGGMIFAVWLALAPIGKLAAVIRQRDPLDLSKIDTPTPRELAPFVVEINNFIERLRGRIELMQHFIGNAAHQLRTPITALNGQVEILSHLEATPEVRRRIERINAQSARLARLANQLLSHAMVTHRKTLFADGQVDLAQIVRRALDESLPEDERDLLVTFFPPPDPIRIEGDPVNIAEAIKNVVDNAIRHGAPTKLSVRIFRESQRAIIEVEDDGPGIPPDKWGLATQRFGLQSTDKEGSGLGLSIASEVVTAHGGALAFRTTAEGFVVVLSFALDHSESAT